MTLISAHSPHLALNGRVEFGHFQPMAHLLHMLSACNSCCVHMCMSSGLRDPVSTFINVVCTVTPLAISYVTYIILAVFKVFSESWKLLNRLSFTTFIYLIFSRHFR